MELRSHPLMSYRSVPNWPPTWVWVAGNLERKLQGEVGILMRVRPCHLGPHRQVCFLWIEHDENTYVGSLLFDDETFHHLISKLLEEHCGSTIAAIGSLDIGQRL
jgi:hypothetical protein